jgi:hypothetical protein
MYGAENRLDSVSCLTLALLGTRKREWVQRLHNPYTTPQYTKIAD